MARQKKPTIEHPAFTVDADGNGSQGHVVLSLNDDLKFEISLPAYLQEFAAARGPHSYHAHPSAAQAVEWYEALCTDYQSFTLAMKATNPMLMLKFIPTRMATGFGVEMCKVKTTADGKAFDDNGKPVNYDSFERSALFPDTPENETMLTVLVGSVEKAADAIASVISSPDPATALRSLLDLQSVSLSSGDGTIATADPLPTAGVSAEEKAAVLDTPAAATDEEEL